MQLLSSSIITIKLLLILQLNPPSTLSAPLEETKFFGQIVDIYSAPLVASFLHSRIEDNSQMIDKIMTAISDLGPSKRDSLSLAKKSFDSLEKQLAALQKADYFDSDGTEKVRYFINRYNVLHEMFPIRIESHGIAEKFNNTPDILLEFLDVKTNDDLINETNLLIKDYLKDLENKEAAIETSASQKFSIAKMKNRLQKLANYSYSKPHETYDYNSERSETVDNRKPEIEKVLRELKEKIDFFYDNYQNLTD